MAVEFFRTFSDYDRQAAEAKRRRAMADLLAQQVAQPMDYGRAPIPAAAPLVQGLQAFMAARAARKAEEAEGGLSEAQSRAAEQIAGRLTGNAPVRNLAPPDSTGLDEVAVQSRYKVSPQDAFSLALTPAGSAALGKAPVLAELLARQMPQKPRSLQVGPVDLGKLTPESAKRFAVSGNPADIEYRPETPESRIGKPSFSDFTPKSLAEFEKTGNPNVLVAVPRVAPTTNIINRYGSPMPVIDTATGQPVLVQPSQTGGPPSVVQGFAPIPSNAPPMNEGQANAAGFADRIANTLGTLDMVSPSRTAMVAEGLPMAMGASQLSDRDQQFFRAERDFINAVLRRESGAAIGPSEFKSARLQYIPQPGDGPDTLEAKRAARQLALQNMARSAGPAYQPSGALKNQAATSTTPKSGKTKSGVAYTVEP